MASLKLTGGAAPRELTNLKVRHQAFTTRAPKFSMPEIQ